MEWSVGGHLAFGWGSAGVGRGVLEMGSIHICGEREEVGQIPVRERITLTNNGISNRAFLIFDLGSSATFASESVGFKLES